MESQAHPHQVSLNVESGLIQLPLLSELDCRRFVASSDVAIRPENPPPVVGTALSMILVIADVATSPHPSVSVLLHQIL